MDRKWACILKLTVLYTQKNVFHCFGKVHNIVEVEARTDVFELWCWRRLLRVPWTARRSNQLILKEINPEYSFEALLLKLECKYFGHLM